MAHHMQVEVKGQLVGADSLLLPCAAQNQTRVARLSSKGLPAKPAHQAKMEGDGEFLS